ncbi:serine-pyruvate aminotransferase/archaeal aspartate aminotransferase [Caldisphaera lagunensis DSM 15908]|uniref:Serine-pyruvate aminotransferase/archaeal aspartate aminotransferase n=1 Tax=Caldisphaera lagunensis (strain DSM 15908 / JCM 11604 / ANMR 0165 / IC-154) TaxID=1056495 RepID=L0A9R6_CALLD|nr:alanine--glyoxylate aminotransferase family protein [Caldisphaera lagunensis]AFZ70633.1 serine-pyruvate aminotransferase/archaeal aspartate aminotransferase [Caldisphaera lagunensis DSM 15908]
MIKYYTDEILMTPGPTQISLDIYKSMITKAKNTDLDEDFINFYNDLRKKVFNLLNMKKGDIYIMLGEAMLGLEIAVANTVKEGDKVLIIDNGVYGDGFKDLVKMYRGIPITMGLDWRKEADPNEIDKAFEKNKDISLATLVHCDTPSGMLNNLNEISKIVKSHDSYLIVDAVSSIATTNVEFQNIDILIGGSQKALNIPAGLTIMAISEEIWEKIKKVNYQGYYMNLSLWKEMFDYNKTFPYTMNDTLIYALNTSIDKLFEEGLENVYKRHELAKRASLNALKSLNLELYPEDERYSSPSVTAFLLPQGINDKKLREITWKKYGVMIAGSWGKLEGKVARIGHMGYQASLNNLLIAYSSLSKALNELGYKNSVSEVLGSIEEVYT